MGGWCWACWGRVDTGKVTPGLGGRRAAASTVTRHLVSAHAVLVLGLGSLVVGRAPGPPAQHML